MLIRPHTSDPSKGIWERFSTFDEVVGEEVKIDLLVRSVEDRTFRKIRNKFVERVQQPDGSWKPDVPEKKQDAWTKSLMDYVILDWGSGTGDPEEEHPHGAVAEFHADTGLMRFNALAKRYGVPVCDDPKLPDEEFAARRVEPTPESKRFVMEYLTRNAPTNAPSIWAEVLEFARRAGAGDMKGEEAEEGN